MRLPVSPTHFHTAIKASTSPSQFTNRILRLSSNQARSMSSDTGDLIIENTNIKTASGVSLDEQKKTLVGSVLDLFAGRPSRPKLRLWDDNATFEDPITIAKGRERYEAQWYGLSKVFSEIERLHHEVTSGGNPITMDLRTRYVVKLLGKEQTIDSKVNIFYDENTNKITHVQDKWDDKLPDSSFLKYFREVNAVTVPKLVSVPKSDEEDAKLGNQ